MGQSTAPHVGKAESLKVIQTKVYVNIYPIEFYNNENAPYAQPRQRLGSMACSGARVSAKRFLRSISDMGKP